MRDWNEVESKIDQLAKVMDAKGNPIPLRVDDLPDVPFRDWEALDTAFHRGTIKVQKFSFSYEPTYTSVVGTGFQNQRLNLYMATMWLAPVAAIGLGFMLSWRWLALVLLVPIMMGRVRNLYKQIIYEGALLNEKAFCFLYFSGQISLVTPDFETSYYFGKEQSEPKQSATISSDEEREVVEQMNAYVAELDAMDPVEVAREIRDELATINERMSEGVVNVSADEARTVVMQVCDRQSEFDSAEERACLDDAAQIARGIVSKWESGGGRVVPDGTMLELMRKEMSEGELAEYARLKAADAAQVEKGMRLAAKLVRGDFIRSQPPTAPRCKEIHALKELGLGVMANKSVYETTDDPEFKRICLDHGSTSSARFCEGMVSIVEMVLADDHQLWTTEEIEDARMCFGLIDDLTEFLGIARAAGISSQSDPEFLIERAEGRADGLYSELKRRPDRSFEPED